jgi:hypothetical protein
MKPMDKQGFQTMLEGRKVPADKLAYALGLAERFEQYAAQHGGFSTETAWAFSKILIVEGQNSAENFITLARYGLFIQNNPIFVAFLELLDGGEAQENLYHRVAERYGAAFRDEVFAGIGVAPYGLPTPEKPRFMQPVVERLEKALGPDACRALLADSLRDLPDYAWERDIYQSCAGVDEYLTKAYLAESDPTLKRYYYCHCPWAREAVKSGENVAPIFCNCSAGFHKKPWEGALGQKIQVEVLESVLQGDDRCRFAIHLPERVIPT